MTKSEVSGLETERRVEREQTRPEMQSSLSFTSHWALGADDRRREDRSVKRQFFLPAQRGGC